MLRNTIAIAPPELYILSMKMPGMGEPKSKLRSPTDNWRLRWVPRLKEKVRVCRVAPVVYWDSEHS